MERLQVIKIGGNVIDNPEALESFLDDFSKIPGKKILVHGGGKAATAMAARLGVETKMIDGRRITSPEMLDVAVMVYAGLINKKIVAALQSRGTDAIGLSGADGLAVKAVKRPPVPIDYGEAGDITGVNSRFFKGLLEMGLTPVVCAISCSEDGRLLNTNADTIATEIAIGLSDKYSADLIFCFEKDGVLDAENKVIPSVNEEICNTLMAENVISAGMLPKIKNSLDACRKGVEKVIIKNSRKLLEEGGTLIGL